MVILRVYKERLSNLRDAVLTIVNEKLPVASLTDYQKKSFLNLSEDLEFYFKEFDKFSESYHRAWRHVLEKRFEHLFGTVDSPIWSGFFYKNLRDIYLHFQLSFGGEREKVSEILFSQQECSVNFKSSQTDSARAFPYLGKSIVDVAHEIRNDHTLLEDFVIRVCLHHDGRCNYWVTANNRGLAAIYMADQFPLRIRLDYFSADELKRESAPFIAHTMELHDKDELNNRTLQNYKKVERADPTYPYSIIHGTDNGKELFAVHARSVKYVAPLSIDDFAAEHSRYVRGAASGAEFPPGPDLGGATPQ